MKEKILYTGGAFDLFHYGHVNFLRQCKRLCDNVVVALNTDEFVAQYKNPTIMNYDERKKSLLSCPYVTSVIPNSSGGDSKPTILSINPSIIAIGDDWAHKDYYKQMSFTQEWLEEQGIVLVYIPYTKGISSSEIRKRIIAKKSIVNKTAFVISCKESNYIYGCIESIKKIYADNVDIIIVDSCSSDKKYFELKEKYNNLYIEDICNKNYEYGAILHAFKKYNQYEKYIFIQDAMHIFSNLKEIDTLIDNEIYIFGDGLEHTGWGCDAEARAFFYERHPNFPNITEMPLMPIWNSFMIKKETFQKVIDSAIFKSATPPSEKIMSRAWERIWATIFMENGVAIKRSEKQNFQKIAGNRQ